MHFKVYKIMLNASFPIYLQLSMNWKMTVNAISYGVMPYGPTSAGCIGRDIMIFPSGSCHALTKKRNIFSKAWKKSAGYLAVWDFFVTHTSPRASRYEKISNFQSISRVFLFVLSCLSLQVSCDKHHTSPITIVATERGLCAFRRYAVHGYAMPVCRRKVFHVESINISI